MKKGIQYSHYCGTELLELVSSIRLSLELVDENRDESKQWGEYALKIVSQLADKIAELDKLSKEEILELNIATGKPIVYTLDEQTLEILDKKQLLHQ